MRLRLDLAYDGTDFHGWATQPGLRTVQAVLEERLGQLLRLPSPPTLVVAGRTDAGVHARGQVCHVDVPHPLPGPHPLPEHPHTTTPPWPGPHPLPEHPHTTTPPWPDPHPLPEHPHTTTPPWPDPHPLPEEPRAAQRPWGVSKGRDPDLSAMLYRRLRRALPKDLVIKAVSPAPEGFDARFSAVWRRYCYRVVEAETPPDPLLRGHIVALRHGVDLERLNEAAATLIGLRDFAPFCKPREGATTIRDLRELSASRRSDGTIEIHLLADAFCHSMVRSLVGALTAVAAGRRDLAWLERVATHPARHGEILVMPARGLTLEEVGYPPDDELAARALASRARRTLEDS